MILDLDLWSQVVFMFMFSKWKKSELVLQPEHGFQTLVIAYSLIGYLIVNDTHVW